MNGIYQITKRCENDAHTVQWRGKETEHLLSVWLVTSIMLSKGKKLFQKASQLGVHVIYTLYIFAKAIGFFIWFLYISTASLSFLYI